MSSELASFLQFQSSAKPNARVLRAGGRQSRGIAYVNTNGGRHVELSCEGLRLRLCGSRVSNGL